MKRETLGARIKRLRLARQMSQANVAAAVGVSRVAVTQWESGAIQKILTDKLSRLAKVLRVNIDELVEGTPAAEIGARETPPDFSTVPAEVREVAVAYLRLNPVQQAYFREAIFREAAIGSVMPWLRVGKPNHDDYDKFERAVERDFEQRVRQLKLNL